MDAVVQRCVVCSEGIAEQLWKLGELQGEKAIFAPCGQDRDHAWKMRGAQMALDEMLRE